MDGGGVGDSRKVKRLDPLQAYQGWGPAYRSSLLAVTLNSGSCSGLCRADEQF